MQDEGSRKKYHESKKKANAAVAKAKSLAYEDLYDKLHTKEGEKDLYRLAKQRDRAGRDIQQVRLIKDEEGKVLLRGLCDNGRNTSRN